MTKSLNNIFSQYHPAANFIYIAAVIFCAMYTLRPECVLLTFALGSVYSIFLNGIHAYTKAIKPLLIMFVLIVLVNPLTNHRGMTTLFYLFGDAGKPVTFEALLYGLCSGGMLVSVFVWFQCYQALITNDKFMYLFGRALPTSAMVVSMILKLVPVTIRKYHDIEEAQIAINGQGHKADLLENSHGKKKTKRNRIRRAANLSGVLLSRSMEDSIETAESMRARGYGSGKRTKFSSYRMSASDILSIIVLTALFAAVVYCITVSNNGYRFFPMIMRPDDALMDGVMFASYALLLLYPLIIETRSLIDRE